MNRQLIYIPVIIFAALLTGWLIVSGKSPSPVREEHGAEHAEEHGHEEHGGLGHVELTPKARENANLKMETAGPQTLRTTLALFGKIAANEETMAHVTPRFDGVIKAVYKRLGDRVKKGEVLAVVEGNQSLRALEIKAELNGTIVQKEAFLGEVVQDDKTIFTIADLSTVWADLTAYRDDFDLLHEGQPVEIRPSNDNGEAVPGTISYLSPFGSESTQTVLARATIPNPDGKHRPGLFITGDVVIGEFLAPVAIRRAAIQTVQEKQVVFVEEEGELEAREVLLGRHDGDWVEVKSGLKAGDHYVAENSFILKAEIGKGEAAHDH